MNKFQKIEREFLLTDSTVNCYGFRLLTSGYLIDEYKKNPIGYHMHDRPEGVIVKWEDLRIEDDSVYGKPVINMAHKRAEQTVAEVENGFLNAASVGHLVILEYTEDSDQKLSGQTGPTVTKWYNRECSLVDIPGNSNALALFDEKGNEINLADFTKISIQSNVNMKKIEFTASQLGAMSLKADADEVAVATAFDDLVAKAAKADGLQTQLDNLNASVVTDKVKGILTTALAAKKITKELSDKLQKDYAKNPEGLQNLVDALPEYKGVNDRVKDDATMSETRIKELVAKGFDALMESGEVHELKDKAPEAYKEVYKAAFGHDPK